MSSKIQSEPHRVLQVAIREHHWRIGPKAIRGRQRCELHGCRCNPDETEIGCPQCFEEATKWQATHRTGVMRNPAEQPYEPREMRSWLTRTIGWRGLW